MPVSHGSRPALVFGQYPVDLLQPESARVGGRRDHGAMTNLYYCVTCCQTQRGAVMSRGYLVVGGDIGGTNSRLKLYEVKEKDIGLTEGLR